MLGRWFTKPIGSSARSKLHLSSIVLSTYVQPLESGDCDPLSSPAIWLRILQISLTSLPNSKKRGWVVRADDASDLRSYLVVLTPAGRKLRGEATSAYKRVVALMGKNVDLGRLVDAEAVILEIARLTSTAVDSALSELKENQ